MRLDFSGERVLAVVAHPDDAELLCAGTLARARRDGFLGDGFGAGHPPGAPPEGVRQVLLSAEAGHRKEEHRPGTQLGQGSRGPSSG